MYILCCVMMLEDMMPTSNIGCAQSLIANGGGGMEPLKDVIPLAETVCFQSFNGNGVEPERSVCVNVGGLEPLEDVIHIPESGCFQSLIVTDGNCLELSVSRGSNNISRCKSCTCIETGSPSIADDVYVTSTVVSNKRRPECMCTDLSNEHVLILVARHTNWNPFLLCFLSCVCKKTSAISNRILWREFCLSRAPKMVSDLLLGAKDGRIDGGWHALGKLFLYCAGFHESNKSSHFPMQPVASHFVPKTRFSRTSGRYFLIPRCRMDVLYVSDPCEHPNDPQDVGLFRGVFRGFDKSETKKLLTNKRVQLEEEETCPFCKSGVWSMRNARLIPRSASVRLAAYNENVEYCICLNGHVNGRCALLHLSDTDVSDEDE
eukprot:c20367_g1_i2 orf=633-1760(+)